MLEIGSYKLELFAEETKREYHTLPCYGGEDAAVLFFHHLLKQASAESLGFLESLGIDPLKITLCRPLTEPDERGEILYLACAPLCARVLAGGDTEPRQSEEIGGISVIFVGKSEDLSPDLSRFAEPCAELRFVIPLPFDASFFAQ